MLRRQYLHRHRHGCGAAFWRAQKQKSGAYTASHRAEKIIHTEEFATRSLALKREAEIRALAAGKKELALNQSGEPQFENRLATNILKNKSLLKKENF